MEAGHLGRAQRVGQTELVEGLMAGAEAAKAWVVVAKARAVAEMAVKAMEVMMDAAAGTEVAAMATEMGHVAAA